MVVLDSNHTHDNVLLELVAYAPLVTYGSLFVVSDTIREDAPRAAPLAGHRAPVTARKLRWTPDFGRPDKVELLGWEAPYQEQDDGREATSIRGGI